MYLKQSYAPPGNRLSRSTNSEAKMMAIAPSAYFAHETYQSGTHHNNIKNNVIMSQEVLCEERL